MTDTATDVAAAAADSAIAAEGADGPGDPLCVTDPANPACARRMIAVDKLIAHPGNVRENLDLTAEFARRWPKTASASRC